MKVWLSECVESGVETTMMPLLLLACAPSVADHFDVGGEILAVDVEVDIGTVRVIGEDREDVHIERHVAGFLEGGPSLKNGILTVPAECAGILDCNGEIELRIPSQLPISVQVREGDIRVYAMEGSVSLETGRGDVMAEDISGPELRAHLGVGSIQAAFTTIPSGVYIGAGVGDATLTLPIGSYDLELDAFHGIEVAPGVQAGEDALPKVEVRTAAGRVTILAGEDTGS